MSENTAPRGWRPGPGLLVTAAFIGPGTVTTATRAGAAHGLDLLWTIVLAVVAATLLQEMAARLGIVSRLGLAEAIAATIRPAWARRAALGLVLTAMVLGNTAYQTGNLVGAGVAVELLTDWPANGSAAALGVGVAALLAWAGGAGRLTTPLIGLVLAMSAAFVLTAVMIGPEPAEVARSAVRFSIPEGGALTAIALFGTTVVPYNLFLHAAATRRRWAETPDNRIDTALSHARWDTALAIGLGGLVTAAIVTTSATTLHGTGEDVDARALASQLEPLLGALGERLFALGLLAAGVTSAVTAPLAAGYAAAGVFGDPRGRVSRGVAVGVALLGATAAATLGKSPQATIVVAQAANGLLLPLVALFLLAVMNSPALLGARRNGWLSNTAGVAVVAAAIGLGLRNLWRLL